MEPQKIQSAVTRIEQTIAETRLTKQEHLEVDGALAFLVNTINELTPKDKKEKKKKKEEKKEKNKEKKKEEKEEKKDGKSI